MSRLRVPFASLFIASACAIAHAEAPTTVAAALTVDGPGVAAISLTPADLAALPRHTLKVKGHDGEAAVYEGVWLADVLAKAGVPLGHHRLKGPLLAQGLLVVSADGYRVLFALAELDAEFADHQILLADTRDGKPLDGEEGPYRVIVPGEARQGRWARQVTRLRVLPPPG